MLELGIEPVRCSARVWRVSRFEVQGRLSMGPSSSNISVKKFKIYKTHPAQVKNGVNHGWASWSRVSTNKDTSRPNLSDPVKTSEITFIQTGSSDVQPRELIKDGGCVASPTEPIRLGRWRRQKSVRIEQPSSAFLPTPGLNITHQWKTVCPQRQRIRIKAIASSDYVKGWFQSDCQKLLEPEDFIYIFSFSNLCKLIIKIFCVLFQITT